jgi:polyhydroxyalkanoate synthesis regulator phasin
MKKIIGVLLAVFTMHIAFAQPSGMNVERMKERLKERLVPELVSKAKITEKEADKVVDILVVFQQEAGKLRRDESLSEDDRRAQLQDLRDKRNKQLKDIPLTDEQLKAVKEIIDDMQRNRPGGGDRSRQ